MRSMSRNTAVAMTTVLVGLLGNTFAAEPKFDAAQVEFFEKKVRPILVNHCYECHSGIAEVVGRSGLRLDSRKAILKGGDSGPAILLVYAERINLELCCLYRHFAACFSFLPI